MKKSSTGTAAMASALAAFVVTLPGDAQATTGRPELEPTRNEAVASLAAIDAVMTKTEKLRVAQKVEENFSQFKQFEGARSNNKSNPADKSLKAGGAQQKVIAPKTAAPKVAAPKMVAPKMTAPKSQTVK